MTRIELKKNEKKKNFELIKSKLEIFILKYLLYIYNTICERERERVCVCVCVCKNNERNTVKSECKKISFCAKNNN